jgi:hypothetical protein
VIETTGDVCIEDILFLLAGGIEDCGDGIVAAASGPKAVAVGLKVA